VHGEASEAGRPCTEPSFHDEIETGIFERRAREGIVDAAKCDARVIVVTTGLCREAPLDDTRGEAPFLEPRT
jgi:hypothetical protein